MNDNVLPVDGLPIGVYRTSADGRVLAANPALARLFGFATVEALRNATATQTYASASDRAAHLAELADAKGGLVERELVLRDLAGNPVIVRDRCRAILEDGRLVATEGIMEDVTRERLAQQAVEASRARYRELLDNATDIVYVHDLQGRFTDINRAAVETLGYDPATMIGMRIQDVIDPSYWELASAKTREKIEGRTETSAPYELMARDRQGRALWLEVSSRLVMEGGKPVGVQGVARDVTERHLAQQGIRMIQDLGRRLQDALSLGDALELVVDTLDQWRHWAYTEVWLHEPVEDVLVCHAAHRIRSSTKLLRFRRLGTQLRLGLQEGTEGVVWSTGRALVVHDFNEHSGFVRAAAARAAGLAGCAIVPVLARKKPVALLFVFDDKPLAHSQTDLELLAAAADQMGAAIARLIEDERHAQDLHVLAAQAESSFDGLLALDATGLPLRLNARLLAMIGVNWRHDKPPSAFSSAEIGPLLGQDGMQALEALYSQLQSRRPVDLQAVTVDVRRIPLPGVKGGWLYRLHPTDAVG